MAHLAYLSRYLRASYKNANMCEHVIERVLICVRIRSPRVPKSFRLLHLCEGGDYFGQCGALVAMYHGGILYKPR